MGKGNKHGTKPKGNKKERNRKRQEGEGDLAEKISKK